LARDISSVAQNCAEHAFYMKATPVKEKPIFEQLNIPTPAYIPPDAWAGPALLEVYANEGFMGCFNVPERAEPKGAIAKEDKRYKGEAYVVNGKGEANVVSWSPNAVAIDVRNAAPGAVLVWNMNFEPSWRANGKPAMEWEHAVSAPITSGTDRIVFSYYPRTLNVSLGVLAATVFLAFVRPLWRRRRLRRAKVELTERDSESRA
jgi:hypothetical protein